MIKRRIADKLVGLAETFPVVTIEGPRQSGKTTLARMTFPGHAYANLEESATRALAEGDPRGFLGAVVYAGEDWSVDGVPFVHFAETSRLVAGAD